MSSPEVERFEISEADLADEFNPHRRRFRQTKNQAVYGIWADQDSDDERPGFGGGKRSSDYTAPVNFVSGGIKMGSKIEKEGEEDEDEEPDSDSDDEEFDRQRFSSAALAQDKRPRASFGRHPGPIGSGIGSWEKHTRGIGMKLLGKMGHVPGRGLGKNLQGISTPVEAFKRKGKGTIGFHGTERTERSLKDFPVQDKDQEEEEQFIQQLQQWKKGQGEKKKKPKYNYKTADELVATGGKKKPRIESELAKVKVIDMTGREKRVLSGYHAISQKHDMPDEELEPPPVSQGPQVRSFDMPELLHNLDLLVDMAEDEIIQNTRRLRHEKDMVVNLKHEHEKSAEVCAQEDKQLEKLKTILDIVEKCEERSKPGSSEPLTLEECAEMFKKLEEEYYEEYRIYELSTLAVALVEPLMKKEFEGWDPLKHARKGIVTMRAWKDILEDSKHNFGGTDEMDPYERLLWDVWMPHIRKTVSGRWQVRDCDPLIEVLEAWLPMLPGWMLDNILDQQVVPRLQNEVESWNPLTDTMPIHAWLHPWLPLMSNRLESLYPPIRHKLANALTNWHPSDPSAKMILQPWVSVFQKVQMDAFVVKNILPKLAICMQEFVINPHQQHLDAWTWVMAWLDMVPTQIMVSLMEKHFFPKWLQVLCTWLSNNPNYDEVTKWYMGWKSMFPEQLINHQGIKDQFNKALEIMNRFVSGHYQPGARENVAYLTHTERRQGFDTQLPPQSRGFTPPAPPAPPRPPIPPPQMMGVPSQSVPSNFKDLIARKAEENNLIFVPIPNRTYEAKQVYRFGRQFIYLDRSVIFMQQDAQQFIPVSLQGLIDRAR